VRILLRATPAAPQDLAVYGFILRVSQRDSNPRRKDYKIFTPRKLKRYMYLRIFKYECTMDDDVRRQITKWNSISATVCQFVIPVLGFNIQGTLQGTVW
jgi:hypothetical protein